jgi:hypothetical protein
MGCDKKRRLRYLQIGTPDEAIPHMGSSSGKNSGPEGIAVTPKDPRVLIPYLQCAETARKPSRDCIVSDTIPDWG